MPGAWHVDWATDIVDPDWEFAFMLAPPAVFSAAMERVGIGDDSTVVAYADEQGSGPYRLWWAFRVHGHDDGVRILNGEFERWVAEGRPVSTDPPSETRAGAVWTPRPSAVRPATVGDVLDAANRSDVVVLDSIGELAVVAELVACDQAGRGVRQPLALQWKRIGAGAKARVAVAEVTADPRSPEQPVRGHRRRQRRWTAVAVRGRGRWGGRRRAGTVVKCHHQHDDAGCHRDQGPGDQHGTQDRGQPAYFLRESSHG